MKPHELSAWVGMAQPGERVIYFEGPHASGETCAEARRLYERGVIHLTRRPNAPAGTAGRRFEFFATKATVKRNHDPDYKPRCGHVRGPRAGEGQ